MSETGPGGRDALGAGYAGIGGLNCAAGWVGPRRQGRSADSSRTGWLAGLASR